MKNVINRALAAEKKLFVLALSAVFVANLSAQECKKDFEGKKLSKEERVELDVKRLSHELLLSDEQAEKFAATYREYAKELDQLFEKNMPKKEFEAGKELSDKELDKLAKQRFEGFKALADLQAKFYDKFRKDLSARQVEKIMEFRAPFGGKHCCGKQCGKHEGKKCEKHQEAIRKHMPAGGRDGFHPRGSRPEEAPKEK